MRPLLKAVLIVLQSGSLNLLEPSGSLQACNGIALPLPLPFYKCKVISQHEAYLNTQFT